ncbi:MAG TPA: hypothetical protein V6D23_20425 [Candidatus Obscuribacterales bacterium]
MRPQVILCLLCLLTGPALAQWREPIDDLLLPDAQQRRLVYRDGKPVWLLLSSRSVEQSLLEYLRLSRQPGWKLTFPDETEARAWLEGLRTSHESKVFMLNLYHSKTKLNYVLTVGALSDTRLFSARSIITIYSTQHAFGHSPAAR